MTIGFRGPHRCGAQSPGSRPPFRPSACGFPRAAPARDPAPADVRGDHCGADHRAEGLDHRRDLAADDRHTDHGRSDDRGAGARQLDLRILASSLGTASGWTVPITVEKGYFNVKFNGKTVALVPEPLTVTLMLLGCTALAARHRMRRR